MISIYEELTAKVAAASSRGARDGARRDLGLLLFAERAELDALWKAADRSVGQLGAEASSELRAAIERLRPLFGERAGQAPS